MTRLVASGGDLLRCRFATSPLWETVNAVRAFVDPRSHPYLRPWWEQVRGAPPAEMPLAVQTPRGYTPDFLSPPPREAAPSVEDQLAAVRATPPEQVRAELRRVDLSTCPSPAAVRAMIADPETARDALPAGLERPRR
ncbi:hypothetical protein [Actinoallomurus acaciae]|uniref:Uncharacterized protein n=1 Tax=Actinoallomurus acaciae TaxID=502577 RepID=A0ABV5Z0N6_9ACTN